jgi:acyl-CoA thioesterase-1
MSEMSFKIWTRAAARPKLRSTWANSITGEFMMLSIQRQTARPKRFRWPRIFRLLPWLTLAVCGALCPGIAAQAQTAASAAVPIKIIAFGDSLSAGYLLPESDVFPTVLQKALRAEGKDVTVVNGGVSGDTSTGGLARLDWTLGDGADAVILELGANDMLRGVDPAVTKRALASILEKLKARHIKVLLAGMLAEPTLGKDYVERFEAIYPALAKQFDVPLYPFFLDGMVQDSSQKLSDGMHPNKRGVETIVAHILPSVNTLLKTVEPRS